MLYVEVSFHLYLLTNSTVSFLNSPSRSSLSFESPNSAHQPEMGELCLPERMFAAGEEPNGERVNTYHKPKRIESIIEALDPDEVDFLRSTTFGKIISQAENPSFSGSFGQFVIVHMLRVKKKYEIWFLFAGRPIRMSLHEFAHVTELNCKKIPIKNTKKRKKNPINEKLYWGELFGSLKFCLVNLAIEMLKKRDQGP